MNKKEMIKGSLDVLCLKSHIKLVLCVYIALLSFIIIAGIVIFWGYPKEMLKAVLVYCSVYSCGYIPAIIFPVIKIIRLLKKSDTLYFFDTTLNNPRSHGRKFYFPVTFTDKLGNTINAATDAIFTSGVDYRNWEKWVNNSINAAYDQESGKIIVIYKKADNVV